MTVGLAFAGQTEEISHNKPFSSKKDASFTTAKGNSHYTVQCKDGWGFFSDRPGNHKPYVNSSDYYTTICSDDAKKGVSITFQQFNLEKFDKLSVWDESRSAPVGATNTPELLNVNDPKKDDGVDYIGSYTGPSSPGTLTSKRGCLTFRFQSDVSVVSTGWYGKIGCANKPTTNPCTSFSKLVDSDLKCGVTITDDNFRGKNNYDTYGTCTMPGWPSTGREIIYRFVNHKASDLTFTLKEDNGSQPKLLNMFILNNCSPDACTDAILRPAENPNQGVESITISDAPAGTYYVVVDGNQTYAHNSFTLGVECAGGSAASCPDNAHYFESFEGYRLGKGITTLDSDHWSTVGNSSRSAEISNDRASNYKQSLEFNRFEGNTQDVNLDLGKKFKGSYRVSWDMYIPPMSAAHFGLFGGDNSDPWGSFGYTFRMLATKYQGRWFDVEIFVDMDKNRYILYMDNRHYVETGSYYLNLHHLNFYSPPAGHFYVDNICYGAVGSIPNAVSSDDRLAERQFTEDLTVFPNPATEEVLIDMSGYEGKAVDLVIQNSMAVEVYRQHIPEVNKEAQRISLESFNNGLYIINVKGKGLRTKAKKLIVSKLY